MRFELIAGLGQNFEPGFASSDSWLSLLFIYLPIAIAPLLFTWFLPTIMGYRRGGMASVGAAISVLLTVALLVQSQNDSFFQWYYKSFHPCVFVVFYIYAVFGVLLCGVGVRDRKRSAIWASLGVVAFTLAAIVDTAIWFGLANGEPWVPIGFLVFCITSIVAFVRVPADKRKPVDIRDRSTDLRNNRTRLSNSIPRTLLRNGNLHLLPVYYVMCLSDLGREGIRNSGSYFFADHIYKNQPSGKTFIGQWLDGRILAMPATRAFGLRYKKSQLAIRNTLERLRSSVDGSLNLMAVPCGIPRDLTELCETLAKEDQKLLDRIQYFGMDLDPDLVSLAREFTKDCLPHAKTFICGNALKRDDYPNEPMHMVVSTGLGEFLADDEISVFYENVFNALEPGGSFYTSATNHERNSERLMSAFELYTNYRDEEKLRSILGKQNWSTLEFETDQSGLQTFVIATK